MNTPYRSAPKPIPSCAAILLTLAAVIGQSPQPLPPGNSVELKLDASRQVTATVTPARHDLVRVLVTGIDNQTKPSVKAKAGRRAIKAAVYRFQNHSVIEWPATNTNKVTLTIKGKQAGHGYRVKWFSSAIPKLAAGGRSKELAFDCAIVPTSWCRISTTSKSKFLLHLSARIGNELKSTVFGPDGVKTRHAGRGGEVSWTSRHQEEGFLRIQRPLQFSGTILSNLYLLRKGKTPRLLKIVPPPELEVLSHGQENATWPQEEQLVVEANTTEPILLDLGEELAGKAIVIATTGGSLEDPVLGVRDGDNSKLLAWDDDSGDGKHAKLIATVDEDGYVGAFVQSLVPGQGGKVTIRYQPCSPKEPR